jgi:hypothetical protein
VVEVVADDARSSDLRGDDLRGDDWPLGGLAWVLARLVGSVESVMTKSESEDMDAASESTSDRLESDSFPSSLNVKMVCVDAGLLRPSLFCVCSGWS